MVKFEPVLTICSGDVLYEKVKSKVQVAGTDDYREEVVYRKVKVESIEKDGVHVKRNGRKLVVDRKDLCRMVNYPAL
jgi:hypothetical protein